MNATNLIWIFICILTAASFSGCKKMIEIDSPQNQLTTDKVFADSASATAAMVNIYALFNIAIDPNYNKFLSCYADELTYVGATQEYLGYVQGTIAPSNSTNSNFWQTSYFAIYSCNSVIEQLQKASGLSKTIISGFTGEAKFLRAFSYFYLINTYGAVPLNLQTDVNVNAKAARTDSITVYQQIIQDLKDAQSTLPINYVSTERVRANKYSASALLARVYLWQSNWANAEASATSVLESGLYTPLPATGSAFLSNSRETILAFWTQYGYVNDNSNFVPSGDAPQFFYTPAQLSAFEAGDQRKSNWILTTTVGPDTYYSPYKYHNVQDNSTAQEYLVALRAGEQYLIRAEARAQQNNVSGALADLNAIRKRAGLNNFTGGTDKTSVLAAILHERRMELFTEWGNRYLDLKRTGALNTVIGPIKPAWKSSAAILPIPQTEINTNPNLKQNPGY
jgi:hypothetical protein